MPAKDEAKTFLWLVLTSPFWFPYYAGAAAYKRAHEAWINLPCNRRGWGYERGRLLTVRRIRRAWPKAWRVEARLVDVVSINRRWYVTVDRHPMVSLRPKREGIDAEHAQQVVVYALAYIAGRMTRETQSPHIVAEEGAIQMLTGVGEGTKLPEVKPVMGFK